MRRIVMFSVLVAAHLLAARAEAGPETALRELASGQIKKGVRTIGMGGDGATTGNYSLVYKDAGSALVDYGAVRYGDTSNVMTFTAVGLTTPHFWDGSALYVIGLSQHANDVRVWTLRDFGPGKPPSLGDGSNQAVFVKFAKPLGEHFGVGLLGGYELSQMTLLPMDGSAPIRFQTQFRPSFGAGVHYEDSRLLIGLRVLSNNDRETRDSASGLRSGELNKLESRAGIAFTPWKGTILDAGVVRIDRWDSLANSDSHDFYPTVGVEQAILPKRVWVRGGLDETTWAMGMSARARPFKLDIAYLHNIAEARTGDVFGHRNKSVIFTLNFEYEALLEKHAPSPPHR